MSFDLENTLDRQPSLTALQHTNHVNDMRGTHDNETLSFYKKRLTGFESCQFPTTKGDLTAAATEFTVVPVDIRPLVDYEAFTQQTGATLENTVNLAWCLVLRVFSQSADVCFGYSTAGCDVPVGGEKDGIGPFVDMTLCRQNLEQSSTVIEALQNIQSDYLVVFLIEESP